MKLHSFIHCLIATLSGITLIDAYQPLSGVRVVSLQNADPSGKPTEIDVGEWLSSGKRCVVFGTYAADFNAIEYGQRLRYYWPKLQESGVEKCSFILNCQPEAAKLLKEVIDLPDSIEIWVDNEGKAGRAFGVERGWLPENDDVNPFLKLFGMLFGLGAWATLPAVIGGYIGNPFVAQPWIEDALAVGQRKGRWPDTALELNADGSVKVNKFAELPWVGSWPRRPLELATLRLQSMIGISLSKWKELAPDEAALEAGVLTQLGGCLIVSNDKPIYEWRDPGICAVVNFEDVLKKI
ncbi:hypothetical protein FisN_1Lh095 [Fistulifera solaris]|uniref:Thioredoxin-like fold domain-containing protein n=1 Tax=Fistulifera solaris TaxID=1519565 RepID=A0A1Z5K4X8_FISSO|nr:hypothetical protein FisN_1Lh095 [Fistulifera solaris]|eukprot:GAX21266.1 hypothetical protein FisN_1Lh095 [Fistulifera solaris]